MPDWINNIDSPCMRKTAPQRHQHHFRFVKGSSLWLNRWHPALSSWKLHRASSTYASTAFSIFSPVSKDEIGHQSQSFGIILLHISYIILVIIVLACSRQKPPLYSSWMPKTNVMRASVCSLVNDFAHGEHASSTVVAFHFDTLCVVLILNN